MHSIEIYWVNLNRCWRKLTWLVSIDSLLLFTRHRAALGYHFAYTLSRLFYFHCARSNQWPRVRFWRKNNMPNYRNYDENSLTSRNIYASSRVRSTWMYIYLRSCIANWNTSLCVAVIIYCLFYKVQ